MDQCETGQGLDMPDGSRVLARKTTGWITNSKCIADELSNFQCRNRSGGSRHDHMHLIGGKAKFTAAYTMMLVTAVLRGLREQMEQDGKMSVNSLEPGATGHDETEYPEEDVAEFYDDVSGELLPTAGVRQARKEELEFLQSFPVYQKVPEGEAKGKTVVSVRWCDVNKGDDETPNLRSRL
eukprot:2248307-Amphidinium_carterae.1